MLKNNVYSIPINSTTESTFVPITEGEWDSLLSVSPSDSIDSTNTSVDDNLESLLLKFKLARRKQVARTTYQDFPGELDVERYYIYKDPNCFRTTEMIDSGVVIKKIIIADPSLSLVNPVNSIHSVSFLLNKLFEAYKPEVYVWTGEFQLIQNTNQFYNYHKKSIPLLKSELEQFKISHRLNYDDVFVLDQSCLQAIASYISCLFEFNSIDYVEYEELPTVFPIKTQYFISEAFMLLDENQLDRIYNWHIENNHPLHIRLNGFSKNRLADFIRQLQKYPQIILYFDDLVFSTLKIWLSYLKAIPIEQIIGVYRKSARFLHAPNACQLLLDYVGSLVHLRYLYFIIDETNTIKKFNLSQHTQLIYLSIEYKDINTESSDVINLSGSRVLPPVEETDVFLSNLPTCLNYLSLPSWEYSYACFHRLICEQLPNLLELGSERTSLFGYFENGLSMYPLHNSAVKQYKLISDKSEHKSIEAPQLKIFGNQYDGYVKGRLDDNSEPFFPFVYPSPTDDFHGMDSDIFFSTTCHFAHFRMLYNLVINVIITNPDISLSDLNDYISRVSGDGACWNIDLDGLDLFDANVLLLILKRLEPIQYLSINPHTKHSVEMLPLNDNLRRDIKSYIDKIAPVKVEFFECTYKSEDIVEKNLQFSARIISKLDISEFGFFLVEDDSTLPFLMPSLLQIKRLIINSSNYEFFKSRLPDDAMLITSRFQTTELLDPLQFALEDKDNDEDEDTNDVDEGFGSFTPSIDLTNDLQTVENPQKQLKAIKIFYDKFGQEIPVNYHRINVLLGVGAHDMPNIKPIPALFIWNELRYLITWYSSVFGKLPGYYLGNYQFPTQEGNWHIIPVLHCDDNITCIEANQPIEFQYRDQSRISEVRALASDKGPLIIRYQMTSDALSFNDNRWSANELKTQTASDWILSYKPYFSALKVIQFAKEGVKGLDLLRAHLPNSFTEADLVKLICAYFADFTSGSIHTQNNAPHEVDQAIFSQKVGACRHRAKLAYKLFYALNIRADYIINHVHSFLHVFIDNQPIGVCLGGFSANIEVLNQEHVNGFYLADQNTPNNQKVTEIKDELYLANQDSANNEQVTEITKLKALVVLPKEINNENQLLISYPQLDLPNENQYKHWLSGEINKKGRRRQVLLVVDSFDPNNSLERLAADYIQSQKHIFAEIEDLQRIKFTELHIDHFGNQHTYDNDLGNLVKNGGLSDLLWVTIHRYQAATINPLFDHRRQLRNKKIPADVFIIALIDQEQFSELREDFISRFPSIYKIKRSPTYKLVPAATELSGKNNFENEIIKGTSAEFIFGDPFLSFIDFAGGYALKKDTLSWTDGWLNQQIERKVESLILVNAPDVLPEFQSLMHSIKEGRYYSNGKPVLIPVNMNISFKQAAYNNPACYSFIPYHQATPIQYVLNKHSYMQFLKGSYYVKDGVLRQCPIIDPAVNNAVLNVLVTETLSDGDWYTFLTHIDRLKWKLNLITTKTVSCLDKPQNQKNNEYKPHRELSHLVQWTECADPVERLNALQRPGQIEIMLSHQSTIADLFGTIVIGDKNSEHVIYQETEFNEALRAGKPILLYGNPSLGLRNALESLLCSSPYLFINGQKEWVKGNLHLCFTINKEKSIIAVDSPIIEQEKPQNREPIVFNPQLSHSSSSIDISLELQIDKVLNYIKQQRVTFISGLPQSIKPQLFQQLDRMNQVHWGVGTLNNWLQKGGVMILDHYSYANLNEMALVEQFYNATQTLFWQGKLHPLSDSHRILLINSTRITEHHASLSFFRSESLVTLEYKAFSNETHRDEIVWPAWKALSPLLGGPVEKSIIEAMINEYSQLGAASERHRRCYSGLTVLYYLWKFKDRIDSVETPDIKKLCHLTLHILSPKMAENSKPLREMIQKIARTLLKHELPHKLINHLTPMQSVMALNLLIQLQLLEESKSNPHLSWFMVRGLILEGAPGIGKTYLTLEILKALGYREAFFDGTMNPLEKGYVLAPTDDLLRCKKILSFGREQGYLVLFDELNTLSEEVSERNERSLIAELIEALEPVQRGNTNRSNYFIIANQNTASGFSNRLTLPPELQALFLVVDPGHFRKRDYHYLAENCGAENPNEWASSMKKALKSYEKLQGAYRQPTIRTLLDCIFQSKNEVEARIRKEEAHLTDDAPPSAKKQKIN